MPYHEPELYCDENLHDGIASSEFLYRLAAEDLEDIARKIAALIRGRLQTLASSCPSLERLAEEFGAKLRWESSLLDSGGYVGPFHETDMGQLVLQPGLSHRSRWRVFIHELAHHLMRVWVALDLYHAECVVVAGVTDTAPIRQELAQRVEALLIPPHLS
jgi:hypothetical protein